MRSDQSGESTWSDEYRDVIDFFYWEPQHLGRKKDPLSSVSSAQEAWTRVAGLEVATNHILNFYLAIATLDAINEDESWAPHDSYRLVGSQELEDLQRSLGGFTQADVLLRGQRRDCAIELKIRSAASVAQVRKYAELQARSAPDKPLTLVLLTPHREVATAFTEGLPDETAVVAALAAQPPTAVAAGLVTGDAYRQVLDQLDLRMRTYSDLFASVEAAMLAEASRIARRVHQGMLSWLAARGLT